MTMHTRIIYILLQLIVSYSVVPGSLSYSKIRFLYNFYNFAIYVGF
jgi:hypothetical protein